MTDTPPQPPRGWLRSSLSTGSKKGFEGFVAWIVQRIFVWAFRLGVGVFALEHGLDYVIDRYSAKLPITTGSIPQQPSAVPQQPASQPPAQLPPTVPAPRGYAKPKKKSEPEPHPNFVERFIPNIVQGIRLILQVPEQPDPKAKLTPKRS